MQPQKTTLPDTVERIRSRRDRTPDPRGLPSVFVVGAVQEASRTPALAGVAPKRTPPRRRPSDTRLTAARAVRNMCGLFLPGRPPMFSGALATPPSATRLSGLRPDPWLCVPASRRVCLYREGVF